jgi:hypothetical protein
MDVNRKVMHVVLCEQVAHAGIGGGMERLIGGDFVWLNSNHHAHADWLWFGTSRIRAKSCEASQAKHLDYQFLHTLPFKQGDWFVS